MLHIAPETIEACRRGDAEAFENLVRETHRFVYSIVYRMVGNRDDAADATQDAYVRVWRGIRRSRSDVAFPSWLQRVATNETISFLRRRGRLAEPMEPEALASVLPPSPDSSTHLPMEGLEEALGRLPVVYRVVLVMKEIYGFTIEEIARDLGSTPGAVKVRLFRARRRLAQELVPEGIAGPLRRGRATS